MIIGVDDVPESTMKNLGRNILDEVLVKWWGEESYSALLEKNFKPLARNQVDEFRANRSQRISKLYHEAVRLLRLG